MCPGQPPRDWMGTFLSSQKTAELDHRTHRRPTVQHQRFPPNWCPAPLQRAAELLRRWQRVMTGSQRSESLIAVSPRGSYLTLGEPQFPPLPNGAIRTSLLGWLWDGVTTGRIHSMAIKTLGMHPVWQVIYVLSLLYSLHPPYKGGTLVHLHFTEVKWFAQTLPTSQWQSRTLHPK